MRISNFRRISNLLFSSLFWFLFEVQTLFPNMAANSNEQIEGQRKSFPLSIPKKAYFLVSPVILFALF